MYIFLIKFDGNQNIIILVTLMYYDIIKIYVFLCVYQEGCPLFIIFSLAGRIIGITISLVLITLIIIYILEKYVLTSISNTKTQLFYSF